MSAYTLKDYPMFTCVVWPRRRCWIGLGKAVPTARPQKKRHEEELARSEGGPSAKATALPSREKDAKKNPRGIQQIRGMSKQSCTDSQSLCRAGCIASSP